MRAATCLICGGGMLEPHLGILRKCAACGFVTYVADKAIDIRRLYEGDYFKGDEYLDYAADEPFYKKNFRKRLDHVLRHRSSGRLLEIGAAYGFFLDLARQHFDVVGFEVNQEGARHGREHFGVDIRTESFLDASGDDIGGPVDVTVMWDVIEHLERPDLFVEHVAKLSNPGAVLCITTGDVGSRLARLRGRKWRMIHPPTHLHYFDRKTLPALLKKSGFRTVDMRSISVARSVRQILYSVIALQCGLPAFYETLCKAFPRDLGFSLNTGDILQVTATLHK